MAAIAITSPVLGSATVNNQDSRVFGHSGDRRRVSWDVTWSVRTHLGSGEVVDACPRGMFLRATSGVAGAIQAGSRVALSFLLAGSDQPWNVEGVVRRIGQSYTHGCMGYGIELDEPQHLLFRRLWQDHAESRHTPLPAMASAPATAQDHFVY